LKLEKEMKVNVKYGEEKESLVNDMNEYMLAKEIEDIEREIAATNLDAAVADMVEDWNESRKGTPDDAKKVEIRNFVTTSFASKPEKPAGRLFIRYSILAAAVITGAILIIRVLSPGNQEKLFSEYHEPFKAVSEVTRGTDASGSFAAGIESYRNSRYLEAYAAFSDVLQKDQSSVTAHFFLGITCIATGDYEKAAEQLKVAAGAGGEYSKEAEWYLGLALLGSGDINGAKEKFGALAQSPGYYSSRAAKILRRLK
jgi:TolA-binding protein